MMEERPTILLRADASSLTGFGHFVRTCALAGYLRNQARCVIYSYNQDFTNSSQPSSSLSASSLSPSHLSPLSSWQILQAEESGAELRPLIAPSLEGANQSFLQEVRKFAVSADSDSPAHKAHLPIIILDNYYFEADYQQALMHLAKKLICFDDMHVRRFVCDQVISFIPFEREIFSLSPETELLAGFEYAPLRAPFLDPVAKSDSSRMQRPYTLTFAMGGADPLNLTNQLLPRIRQLIPDAVINVVAGQTVKLSSEIDSMPRVIVHRSLSAARMANLFDNSDLGIFPASTICIEGFARRLPVAIGYFTDNQIDFYHEAVNRRLAFPLGDLRNPDLSFLKKIGENKSERPSRSYYRDKDIIDFEAAKQNFITKILLP